MAKKKVAKKRAVKSKSVARASPAPVRAQVSGRKRNSQTFAIVTLLLNVFIPLGIGSILGGRVKEGIAQVAVMILGLLLSGYYLVLAVPLIVISWIWQVITGILMVQASE